MTAPRLRVGVYVDDVFDLRDGGTRIVADRSFMSFAAAVVAELGSLTVIGRRAAAPIAADHVLPAGSELVELPYYESLLHPRAVFAALPRTLAAFWRALGRLDVVWVFGPHPFGLLLVVMAVLRRRAVVLGVRQDTVAYYRSRSHGRRTLRGLGLALDAAYRVLARRLPLTVVGHGLAERYAGAARILPMTVTLVPAAAVAARLPERDWSGEVRLLTVGRVDREKNPLLLVELMRLLEERRPGRYRLDVAGSGPLEGELAGAVERAGLGGRVRMLGYIPFGEPLLELYRSSHLFVHVSLTEGVPQVLVEAMASGTPIVATDVGGVAGAVEEGGAGVLVPPESAEALARAVISLDEDEELRLRIAARGLELARSLTLEAEARRVAGFVRAASGGREARTA